MVVCRKLLFLTLVANFLLIETRGICAFSPKDDYLWIELGKQIREKNGSITQPLFICYGRFPDKRGNVSELEHLRGFYTLNEKDEKGENIFYAAGIEKDMGLSLTRINSLKTNRFTVLVRGEKIFGKVRHNYLAKTSFFLFGNSPIRREEIKPVPSNRITKRLDICITPEHSIWPQTGVPVNLTATFDKNPLAGEKIRIIDESGDCIDIETDKAGNSIYTPPDDKRLRRRGLTAYKQTILLAEETKGNTIYKSSYTLLLHRSRFGNRNFPLGSSIFGGTMAIVFMVVFIERRNFKILPHPSLSHLGRGLR